MNIEEHKKEFDRIVKKYGLSEESKATEIASYLLKGEKINSLEFSRLFAMDEKDALVFLSFLEKGIRFKEESLDKK